MWLRDFLPAHVPNARILTYGYDSALVKNSSNASIREFSQNFLEALKTARARKTVSLGFRLTESEDLIFLGTMPTYNINWS